MYRGRHVVPLLGYFERQYQTVNHWKLTDSQVWIIGVENHVLDQQNFMLHQDLRPAIIVAVTTGVWWKASENLIWTVCMGNSSCISVPDKPDRTK